MVKLSQSTSLILIGYLIGLGALVFGFNAIFNPVLALSLFEFEYPQQHSDSRRIIDAYLLLFGVRDIFMGAVTIAAAYYRHPKILGITVLASGGVAVADGAICYYMHGKGHWNHWGFMPVVFGVGASMLGAFDSA